MTTDGQSSDKKIRILRSFGAIIFLFLGIMAVLFYEERVAFADASFQLFSIIVKGDFAIQAGRFGAVVTQGFPLAAVKLGLPLRLVMLSYSLAFVVFPFLLWLILAFVIKNRKMAMVLALFTILLTNETFYWIQSELLQGCVLVIFLFGWIDKVDKIAIPHLIGFYLLTAIVLFIHPLGFIPFAFLWFYFLQKQKGKNRRPYLSLVAFAFLLMLIKHFFLPSAEYDTISMGLAQKAPQFWKFFRFQSTRNFWGYCLTDYYLFPVLLIWVSYFYYQTKKKWRLFLMLGFTLGYLQLVNATFSWGPSQFHIESFYQVLSIFLLVPFIHEVLPKWRTRFNQGALILMGIVIIFRLSHICIQHRPYTLRINWLKEAMVQTWQYPETKFVINEKQVPIDIIKNGWAGAYETLLLSAQQSPDSTRTILIHNDDVPINNFIDAQKAFLTPFGPIPYDVMPQRYFHFRDTSHYRRLLRVE